MALNAPDLYLNQWECRCLGILIDMSCRGFVPCTFCVVTPILMWLFQFGFHLIIGVSRWKANMVTNLVKIVTDFSDMQLGELWNNPFICKEGEWNTLSYPARPFEMIIWAKKLLASHQHTLQFAGKPLFWNNYQLILLTQQLPQDMLNYVASADTTMCWQSALLKQHPLILWT